MDVIPVIPPDLRPLVPLDGGRFATSDLNDLYRRVINRNNRLKKLILRCGRPRSSSATRSGCCRRQWTPCSTTVVGAKPIRGRGKRPLKSLSDMLKGKQGRFRQNLLGKSVSTTPAGRSSWSVRSFTFTSADCRRRWRSSSSSRSSFTSWSDAEPPRRSSAPRSSWSANEPEGLRGPRGDHQGPSGSPEPGADAASTRHSGLRAGARRG